MKNGWGRLGPLALMGMGLVVLLGNAWRPWAAEVDVGVVEMAPLLVTVTEPGKTRVRDRYVIPAPVGGRLERLRSKPGDLVEEGQVLAVLEPPPPDPHLRSQADAQLRAAQAGLSRAQAAAWRAQVALEQANAEAARQRELAEAGLAPAPVLETARFDQRSRSRDALSALSAVKVAAQRLELARAARERLEREPTKGERIEIRAPVKGWVLKVLHEGDGAVAAGTPLLELGDPEVLEVVVDVLSQDAVRIQPGAPVSIEHWGGKGPLEGRVQRVEPSAFTRTSALGVEEQRVRVVVTLEEPVDTREALGNGYRVEARISLWRGERVLQVPERALFRSEEGWAVFLAGSDGRVHERRVKLGQRNGMRAQVLDGLRAGDRVVLNPGEDVRHGEAYEVRPAS